MDRSPLARLAPEIRNRIYEYTFSSIYAVTLRSGACEHPLTQTCAQIRFETLQMFFATGTFNAHLDDDHTTSLAAWLSALGSEKLHWVNKIQIWVGDVALSLTCACVLDVAVLTNSSCSLRKGHS